MKPSRRRDLRHLAWIRQQPCCVCGSRFRVEAHHSTVGRGVSQKTDDDQTMPLCWKCHTDFHDARGHFRDWDRSKRQDWQRQMVAHYILAAQQQRTEAM